MRQYRARRARGGSLSFFLSPSLSLPLFPSRAGCVPFVTEYPFRIGAKNTVAVVADTLVHLRGYLGVTGHPPKYRIGWVSKRGGCIKNAIAGLSWLSLHMTLAFMRARVCLYGRALRTWLFALRSLGRGWDWREGGRIASEMKYFYIYQRRYRWICGAPSNATGRNATSALDVSPSPLAFLHPPPRRYNYINVLSTSCRDKLLRWTDMWGWLQIYTGAFASAAPLQSKSKCFSNGAQNFYRSFIRNFASYAVNNWTYHLDVYPANIWPICASRTK